MARNLVTGGMGFLGSHLARELVRRGEEVVLFDLAPETPRIADIREKVEVLQGQLGNWAEVLEAVHSRKVDHIFHLGAMITVPAEANPWAAYMTNVNGTYHMLEAARHFGVQSVTWPSGIAIYAPEAGDEVNEMSHEENPSQIYAVSKIFGQRMGEYYHHKFGVNFRSTIIPAICGPGRREGLGAYPSLMVHDPAEGRRAELPVNRETQMPFIYIKDAVHSLTALRDADESALTRRVYSVGGFDMTAGAMEEVVREKIPGAEVAYLDDPAIVTLAAAAPRKIDDSRARRDWGWEPHYRWPEAVEDFIRELRDHPERYR